MFGSNDNGFFGIHDGGSSRFDWNNDGKLDWLEQNAEREYDYEQYTMQNKMMNGNYDVDSLLDITDDGLGGSDDFDDDDDLADDDFYDDLNDDSDDSDDGGFGDDSDF